MWDQRYQSDSYVYGKAPNDFLVEVANQLPAKGRILCIAEGEGRNAVWLAEQGFSVTGLDASAVGLHKAERLAQEKAVVIQTVHADLQDYVIEPNAWDGIVAIFCHLPPPLRAKVHQACVNGLRSGGAMVLEAYTPEQLQYKTGGPPTAELMMDAESLSSEFQGLEFLHLKELVREVNEGELHHGTGSVVQLLARKP